MHIANAEATEFEKENERNGKQPKWEERKKRRDENVYTIEHIWGEAKIEYRLYNNISYIVRVSHAHTIEVLNKNV